MRISRDQLDVVRYYWRRPARWRELGEWVRSRGADGMELRSPWWPFMAVNEVRRRLPSSATVLEYGGGGSTAWLEDLGASVLVIEHNSDWADRLKESLASDRVEVRFIPPQVNGSVVSAAEDGFFDDYVAEVEAVSDGTLDLVIVDGRARVACGLAAASKVRVGGMLLLDDSDRVRYASLHEELATWPRQDFVGVKGGQLGLAQTSVWTRPA